MTGLWWCLTGVTVATSEVFALPRQVRAWRRARESNPVTREGRGLASRCARRVARSPWRKQEDSNPNPSRDRTVFETGRVFRVPVQLPVVSAALEPVA